MLLNMADYKKKKQINELLARQRTPLYVNTKTGKISGNDFGDNMIKVKDKINNIMNIINSIKTVEAMK
jgi:hypothetical protein